MGYDLDEVREEIHRYPKLTANDLCASLVDEMIQIRRSCGYSQRKLGSLCGVEQSVVTRMESGTTTPNLRTALNLLAQMGKTLRIVDLKDVEVQCGGDVRRRLGDLPQQERTNVLPEMKRKRNRRKCRRPSLRPRSPLGERIALSYCRQLVVNRLPVV